MSPTLFLVISSFCILSTLSQAPSLLWPEKWQTSRNKVALPGRTLIDFAVYYVDATNNSLRQDVESCSHNKTIGYCQWYFLNHNVYLSVPTSQVCCLAVPNLGPTPPDWIEKLNHTYMGVDTYLGEKVHYWIFVDGDGVQHKYYVRVSDPRFPFSQTGDMNGDSANEYFDSKLVDVFPASTFVLPSATCLQACPKWLGLSEPPKL